MARTTSTRHVETSSEQQASPFPRDPKRRTMPAGRVLVVGLVGLLLWMLLDAPALERSAETSPIGTRRTVALAFLRPMASINRFLQLDHLGGAIDRVAGRGSATGQATIAPVPVTHGRGSGGKHEVTKPLGKPTTDDPLRMVVVGDSFSQGVGEAMSRLVSLRLVDIQSRGVISSGLTRPDFFNWQAQYTGIVDRFKPQVSIVMMGGNDGQTMTTIGSKELIPLAQSDKWRATYAARVAKFMETATDAGGKLIWVGLPPMKDLARDHSAHRLNDIYKEEASQHPGVEYLDTYRMFESPSGGYQPYVRDENGKPQLVRASDGEHFTATGYDWVAQAAMQVMVKRFGLHGNVTRG
jgi:uncharacterized protein